MRCLALVAVLTTLCSIPAPAQSSSGTTFGSAAQINDLCEQYDTLARRITAANDALHSIKSQMAEQGLRLRADILEAAERMQDGRDEAREAITHYDLDAASYNLQLAQFAVETVEKFLGH